MKIRTNSLSDTILDLENVNLPQSSKTQAVKITSKNVMDFYPSRINIEYSFDESFNIYFIKNRAWSAYQHKTLLDELLPNKVEIDRELLIKGVVPFIRDYNAFIWLTVHEKFPELLYPDDLTKDNFDREYGKLLDKIDDSLYKINDIRRGNIYLEGDTEENVSQIIESLGSLFMLYQAKHKLIM